MTRHQIEVDAREFVALEFRLVLHAAQFAVGVGGGLGGFSRQQAEFGAAFQQGDVADVGGQARVLVGIRQDQILHGEFGIDQAAAVVLRLLVPAGARSFATRDGG